MFRSILRFTALAACGLGLTPAVAPAGFFTYTFTGQVTAVDNSGGFFAASATVGALVSGSFTTTNTPNAGPPSSFGPYFTNYLNSNDPFLVNRGTGMAFTIGGRAASTTGNNLSNMIVGDGNPTDGLYTPAGDSFRFAEALDERSPLFDQAALLNAYLYQYMSAGIYLADPTGTAFGSQALPQSGLPLSALTRRYGVVDIYDDDFEQTGLLQFRIDSVRQLSPATAPVPPTFLALLAGAAGLGLTRRRRS